MKLSKYFTKLKQSEWEIISKERTEMHQNIPKYDEYITGQWQLQLCRSIVFDSNERKWLSNVLQDIADKYHLRNVEFHAPEIVGTPGKQKLKMMASKFEGGSNKSGKPVAVYSVYNRTLKTSLVRIELSDLVDLSFLILKDNDWFYISVVHRLSLLPVEYYRVDGIYSMRAFFDKQINDLLNNEQITKLLEL